MLHSTGVSITGPGHVAAGLPNQDALGIYGWHKGRLAVVCDGMGSKPLSHIGSRVAVQATRRVVGTPLRGAVPRLMIQTIYQEWLGSQPAAIPADAASTLLLAAANVNGQLLLAQLGDGLILYRAGGQFGVLTPERTGFGNHTHALGCSKAWSDWHIAEICLSQPGDGVVLMTDGIADDLMPDRREAFFKMITRLTRCRSNRRLRSWLKKQMLAWPTPGHCDDKTIAVIVKGNR